MVVMLYCPAHVCEKEVKQVLNVTNIQPTNERKLSQAPWNAILELRKRRRKRDVFDEVSRQISNIKIKYIFWVNGSSRTQIFWREVISEEWEEGGISFRAKRATPKVVYHSGSTRKCPDFFWVVNSIHFHSIKFSIETCSLSFSCNTKVGWSFSVVNSNYFPPIKFHVVGIFNLRTLVASSNPLSLCHPRLVFCVQICFHFSSKS